MQRPSVVEAIARVAVVGQRVIVDRLDLMRLETRADVLALARTMILLLAAVPVLLAGWMAVMAAVVIALSPLVSLVGALAIIGAVHVMGGAIATYAGVSSLRSESADAGEPAVEPEDDGRALTAPSGDDLGDTSKEPNP